MDPSVKTELGLSSHAMLLALVSALEGSPKGAGGSVRSPASTEILGVKKGAQL